jgi:hypothetical protein
MHRIRSIVAAFLACALPATAAAFDLPRGVVIHGRLETVVDVDEASTPFPFNHASHSPLAQTRFMASVETGNDRYGHLFLKGVGHWATSDVSTGVTSFEADQGDYLWKRSGPVEVSVRAFGNERRYFTPSVGPAVVDDDRVALFENHGGVRVDGSRGENLSWSALGAALDDGGDDRLGLGYAALRWRGARIQGTFSYLADEQPFDTLAHHSVFKGEVVGFYRNATVVVSYEHSGFDDDVWFLPGGRFDWDGYVGSNFAESLPAAGAAFAELRVCDLPVRNWAGVDFVYRYRAVGPDFVNRLAEATPAEVSNETGLFFRHRRHALDGRLVYKKRVRSTFLSRSAERLEGQARALLKNGSEVYLRAAVGHRDEPDGRRRNDNFIHAALQRSLRRVEAGVHAMVVDIDDGEFDRRFAVEARINWSASVSIYGRLIANEEAASNDAVFCRLELRPAKHVFATIGYGRRYIGDGPYVVEDLDVGPTGNTESVYTFSVRGDF